MTEFQIQTINSQVKGCCNLFLDLEGLGLDDIRVFENCDFNSTDISWLNLSNNEIKHVIHLDLIKNIQTLNLSYNQISDISNMPELNLLQKLKLAGNQITSIKGLEKSLTQLQYLDISFNQIQHLEVLRGASKLTHLIANHNRLTLEQLYHIGHLPLVKAVFVYHEKDQIQEAERNFIEYLPGSYQILRNLFLGYLPGSLKYLDKQIFIGYQTHHFDQHLHRLCSSSGVREQRRSLYTKRHAVTNEEKTMSGHIFNIVCDIKNFLHQNNCFVCPKIKISKLNVNVSGRSTQQSNEVQNNCQDGFFQIK